MKRKSVCRRKCFPLTFLKDPRIELRNNLAEQAVKPFVIGRKNWLFFNTPNGAQASAVIYSIIETVKANGLNPQETLQRIFEDIQHGKCPLIFPQINDFLKTYSPPIGGLSLFMVFFILRLLPFYAYSHKLYISFSIPAFCSSLIIIWKKVRRLLYEPSWLPQLGSNQ